MIKLEHGKQKARACSTVASYDYERMIWGAHEVRMSPVYLGAMNLRHVLTDLERVSGTILEIGCGAGSMVRAIGACRPDLEISGCDLSINTIREAKRRSCMIRLVGADATSLPFRSGTFKGVLLFDVLEHLPDPSYAVSEAARVLEPNGLLYISVPLEGRLWTVQGLLRRMGWRAFENTVGHVQAFEINPLREMLADAGLQTTRVRWGGHLVSQIAHTGYALWLSKSRGPQSSMSVESTLSQPDRSLAKRIVGILKNVVAILSYLESSVLTRIPGAAAHITAVSRKD